MEIVFPLSWSFTKSLILFSIVSANSTSQSQTTNAETLTNISFNHKSHFSENDLQEALKTMNENTNHDDFKNDMRLSSTAFYEDGHPTNSQKVSTVKNLFHIFQIKPERSKGPNLNEFNERSLYSNTPLFHKIHAFPQVTDYKSEKRGLYLDAFYPMFYHHNVFNDYARSLYHPFFRKSYELRNVDKRFMNNRQHVDKYAVGNHVYYPEKRLTSFYPKEKVSLSKSIPSSSFLLQTSADSTMRPITILQEAETDKKSTFIGISNEKSIPNQENLNTVPHKFYNISEGLQTEIVRDLPKEVAATNDISLFNPVRNELVLNIKHSKKILENGIIMPPEDEASAYVEAKDSNDSIIIHGKQARSERTDTPDYSKTNTLNLLSNNRVYYEKMPSNTNVSWFVYVSCSRERCHFTNSTNETELMNEGWILQNCTSFGCREMYPQTESIQKFIGLMLLVFSVCILKIVAFLLVFYYCRQIKLTKNESEEEKRLTSDDDGPGFLFGKEKPYRDDIEGEIASTKWPKYTERTNTQQNYDIRHITPDKNRKSNFMPSPNGLSKIHSKVWIPPVQKVSPCLVAEAGDILIPKKCSEKVLAVNNSANLLKTKRKGRSSIPRLENWGKCNGRSDAVKDAKNSKQTCTMKATKFTKQSIDDGELLLMDLDEEICTASLHSPGHIEKASNWESLLEKECRSFITLNLSDEDTRK